MSAQSDLIAAVAAGRWADVQGLLLRKGTNLAAAAAAAGLSRSDVDAFWRAAMPSGGYVARTGGAR